MSRRPEWADLPRHAAQAGCGRPRRRRHRRRSLAAPCSASAAMPGPGRSWPTACVEPADAGGRRIGCCRVVGHGRSAAAGAWVEALGRPSTTPTPPSAREAVAVAKARNLRPTGPGSRALSGGGQPAGLRIAALECVAGRAASSSDAGAFSLLAGQLGESTEPLLRLAAAPALGASTHRAAALSRLAGQPGGRGPARRSACCCPRSRVGHARGGLALVEALKAQPRPLRSWPRGAGPDCWQRTPAAVKERADPLREARRPAGGAGRLPRPAHGRAVQPLQGRRRRRARAVPLAARLGCFGCHRAVRARRDRRPGPVAGSASSARRRNC